MLGGHPNGEMLGCSPVGGSGFQGISFFFNCLNPCPNPLSRVSERGRIFGFWGLGSEGTPTVCRIIGVYRLWAIILPTFGGLGRASGLGFTV